MELMAVLLPLSSCPVARTQPPNHFSFSYIPRSLPIHPSPSHPAAAVVAAVDGGGSNDGGGGGGGGRGGWWGSGDDHDDRGRGKVAVASILSLLCCFRLSSLALARTAPPPDSQDKSCLSVWEVKGGRWTSLVPDDTDDAFLSDRGILPIPFLSPSTLFSRRSFQNCLRLCRDGFLGLMLPESYPNSVTSDYLEYSLWRAMQGVASQISGVLSTQALLFAVGLGKGAIPTAAAISWVLKDGIGYLSKIMLSKYGRHFDVHPKGWRLFADLLENAAYGLEISTPAFPHLFVLIGAAAGAGRSAAALIQAATRNCFYAGFAAQRNFAEVTAKGEAQGMVSKFIGTALGIALANYVSTSALLALGAFGMVSGFHMYCNLKSYQSIQLRTLNPYRASLVFSEYLLSGEVPSVKEVNNVEPLFPVLLPVDVSFSSNEGSKGLSPAAKYAAFQISKRLHLGCRLSEIVRCKEDALALFDLFKDDGYMLAEEQGKFCVMLKEGCSAEDMLKAVYHVNYLHWLETNVGWLGRRSIREECSPGGRLHISLDYAGRELGHVKRDGEEGGWTTDGLVARPSPYRIRAGYD